MAKFRDRTEDFKDDVRHAALSSGYNEVLQLIPIKTLESIGALEQFMLKHRRNYVDFHRTIERERGSIEQEVSALLKYAKNKLMFSSRATL